MKKNLLALSIAAMVGGIAGGANAQVTTNTVSGAVGGRLAYNNTAFGNLAAATNPAGVLVENTDGVGHILLVPYFTTQGENASLLNIVNTDTANGKAVKLRYRGAANSDDLFDITVYLSPGDVWTANVATVDGVSRLITDDKSCTLPSAAEIAATGGKFKTDRLGAAGAAGTREGYIEILNMADIPRLALDVNRNTVANPLFTAIKHVNGVAPCTQGVMDAQENGLTNLAPVAGAPLNGNDPTVRGYSWPTGGLFANWTIVNVGDKASFSGEAVAVEAVNILGGRAQANLVWSPQTTASLTQTQATLLTADPLLAGGVVRAASFDFPDLSTPYTTTATPANQTTALSLALTNFSVSNEFLTNQAVQFATDWVFSMPTRRYAVAMDYAGNTNVAAGFSRTNGSIISNNALTYTPATATTPEVISPVAQFVPGANGNVFLNAAGDRICVGTGDLRAYDREENTKTTFVISPQSAVNLCGEVSVLSFNSPDYSVLGASLARLNINTSYADGWFRINTPGAFGRGLPVVGFAAAKARGANLGGTWAHRYQ